MKRDQTSRTALGTAAGRAIETSRTQRNQLFEDRLAYGLLPTFLKVMVKLLTLPGIGPTILAQRERQFPGIMGNLLCRTRFIDDALRDALREGLDQVVILGAGLDTRAYRIPGIDEARVFELDHPATQAWKRKRLERLLGELPSHVTFVPIDFDRQRLADVMKCADFRPDGGTFLVWEGVTQYISPEAVDATLRYVSRSTRLRSSILFTYIDRRMIEGSSRSKVGKKLMRNLERQGEPWIFGIVPGDLEQYLGERDLELVENVGAFEYRRRYLDPVGRQMNLFRGELIAVARTC
jgi:methyltransferase (TIGR00027 family)